MPIMDMRGAVSWGVGNIVYTHAYIDRAKVSNENITRHIQLHCTCKSVVSGSKRGI